MAIKSGPCKDCERRELGCHSVCEDYKTYAEEMEKLRQERFARNQEYALRNDYRAKVIKNMKRGRGK